MNDDDDELRRLWQSNEPEKNMNQTISLSEIRQQASAFDRKMRFRNLREYVAATIVALGFGWRALHAYSWFEAVACIELVITVGWITATLVMSVVQEPGPDATMREVLSFHRMQLERQIKLLSRAYAWYLAPIAIGIVALMVSDAMRLGVTPFFLTCAGVFVLLFGFIAYINRRAAAKLNAQRAALPPDDLDAR